MTEEDLIGGYWIGTAGYEDGEPAGEPNCMPFDDGIEFKDKETVYVETYDTDFSYWLEDNGDGIEIHFRGEELGIYLSFYIDKINEDDIGLLGKEDIQSEESCYLERQ
ncbi:hypothetical protein [Virgibacillus sp. YIM 98842]|uniref:hypothetical protein n=1 Tax=Virgibacillus sp. YIM 98842 TaxID=2663533 RepID=UPI0013DBA246|nr:hypothetical protein [Virgibacillus sp. YIM 98842]